MIIIILFAVRLHQHGHVEFCYLFFSTGLTNIITVDLHSKEIQGFYDAPVDNLRASPFLVQYITEKVSVFSSLFT